MGARPATCPPTVLSGFPESTYTVIMTTTAPVQPDCGDGKYTDYGYGASASNGILFPASKITMKDITDGTSQTFLVGEMSWDSGPSRVWMAGGGSITTIDTYVYQCRNVYWPLNTACRQAQDDSRPCKYANNDVSFGSLHGGAHFAMCDGSVQFLKEDVPVTILKALASRKSGESFDKPF
jgi:prepilin-type processing-associated H-X9-DG protein